VAHRTAAAVAPQVDAAPVWTVLVAHPDQAYRRQLSLDLRQAGFAVAEAADWPSARSLLAGAATHIGVLDSSIVDLPCLVAGQAESRLSVDHLDDVPPVIITVDDLDGFDWSSFALLDDAADYVRMPIPTADLVRRVSALAIKLARRSASRESAESLRARVRGISAAIRTTNDPQAMTERLVVGIAEVFDVTQVGFTTFSDDRVPRLGFHWQDGVLVDHELLEDERGWQVLAGELWRTGSALKLDGSQSLAGHGAVVSWALSRGAASSVVVPVGEGESAFGLIWIGTADGSRRWSGMEVSLLLHLAGNVAHAIMQAQVITAQQDVLARLRRLDQAKSHFLETVNHELRTPVTSLLAYVELTLDGIGGPIPRRAQDMLRVVERNGKRLEQLIDDVLLISRLAANETCVDWAPVNLTRLLQTVFQRVGPAADAGAVTVCVPSAGPDVVVEGDAGQLHRVFECLADNAVKFTPRGGRVDVLISACALDDDAAGVDIQVADTGSGIHDDERADIFSPFFRGSKARADASSGSGLGMTIVRGLVEGHGGAVALTTTPGGGTTVSVRLPSHGSPVTRSSCQGGRG
jgi:two-component system phosphate regulon sensor histidine kinase PhoR